MGEDKRQRMYGFVRRQVEAGRQVYIVCPAVDEGEALPQWGETAGAPMDRKAVTTYARELRERVFPDLRVGLVHGRLKAREKEAVMSAFSAGELDVLVSTTVIEVGVDVPNASLMVCLLYTSPGRRMPLGALLCLPEPDLFHEALRVHVLDRLDGRDTAGVDGVGHGGAGVVEAVAVAEHGGTVGAAGVQTGDLV